MTTTLSNLIEHLSIEIEPGIRYVYDDSYIVDPILIEQDPLILTKLQRQVHVTHLTQGIRSYNHLALPAEKITEKDDFNCSKFDQCNWVIPMHYLNMSYDDIMRRLHEAELTMGLTDLVEDRRSRINAEMRAFDATNQLDIVRLMCYVVDVMTATNQVWGVGRGSSVSSYVLFLIGVHDVDSVAHDLDFSDFVNLNNTTNAGE